MVESGVVTDMITTAKGRPCSAVHGVAVAPDGGVYIVGEFTAGAAHSCTFHLNVCTF